MTLLKRNTLWHAFKKHTYKKYKYALKVYTLQTEYNVFGNLN